MKKIKIIDYRVSILLITGFALTALFTKNDLLLPAILLLVAGRQSACWYIHIIPGL